MAVKNHIDKALRKRSRHYDFSGGNLSEEDSSDDGNATTADLSHSLAEHESSEHLLWHKTILITGKPGSGKSLAVRATIKAVVPLEMNVLVASPMGFLSSVFKAQLRDNATCETVHSAFH